MAGNCYIPTPWWITVKVSVTNPPLLLGSSAGNNEKTPATKVTACPLKFSQFTWQQCPHPTCGIWHRPEFPACAPALGDDIKIALCKGWLYPERRDPRAAQKNQGVVSGPKLAFQLQSVMETWSSRCRSLAQLGCPCDSKWPL